MENELPSCTYPVSLSRNEYIRFQRLLSSVSPAGRISGFSRWATVGMVLMGIAALAADYRVTGTWDISLTVLIVLVVVMEIGMCLRIPRRADRNNGMIYDRTLYSGYSFDGLVTVENAAIVKKTAAATTEVRYEDCVLFLETTDMMIFCGREGKAIVIPARCLTAEDANSTRQAAMKRIAPVRRRLLSPLIPGALQRAVVSDPAEQAEEQTLMCLDFTYTSDEWCELLTDTIDEQFPSRLPAIVLIALPVTILAYSWKETVTLPVFFLAVLVFSGLTLLLNHRRARRSAASSQEKSRHYTVALTDHGVSVCGSVDPDKKLLVPWTAITRAVERKKTVEFYAHDRFLRLPKRCVKEMELLRRTVDNHVVY